jgi:hypothetical protein
MGQTRKLSRRNERLLTAGRQTFELHPECANSRPSTDQRLRSHDERIAFAEAALFRFDPALHKASDRRTKASG